MLKFIEKDTIQEGRNLYSVNVFYNREAQCFNLAVNSKVKYFFGTPEEFTSFLKKVKASDSMTKPVSKRQVTYKQMVDDIISRKDNTIVIWSNIWKTIPNRLNKDGGY
jgi:hypothetical protein